MRALVQGRVDAGLGVEVQIGDQVVLRVGGGRHTGDVGRHKPVDNAAGGLAGGGRLARLTCQAWLANLP